MQIWLAHRPVEQHDGHQNGAALRTRAAADALHDCIVEVNRNAGVYEITNVAIERPAGMGLDKLLPIYGALCAIVPRRMSVTGMTASEWRKTLGAGPTKTSGHEAVADIAFSGIVIEYDEHELDSIGLALAYRQMLHQAVAA
ncbi:MAG: hypothetical protein H0X39_00095 [Actinobacteria bacterium]|nr:hypothetical protein [Actinomycetota bacterium]